jgi:four helix bundle protein
MHKYSFENLEVWKLSRHLVKKIYTISREFPIEEKYGLTSQLRRAAVSVPTNLAEGSARRTNKDKANFTTNAYSSLMEVLSLLITAIDLGYLEEVVVDSLRPQIEEISNKLNALRKSQSD